MITDKRRKAALMLIIIVIETVVLITGVTRIMKTADTEAFFTVDDMSFSEEEIGLSAATPEITLGGKGIYGVSVYLAPHKSPVSIYTYTSDKDMTGVEDIHLEHPDTQTDYDVYTHVKDTAITIGIVSEDKDTSGNDFVRLVSLKFKRRHTLAVYIVTFVFWAVVADILLFFSLFKSSLVREFIDRHGVELIVFVITMLMVSIPIMIRGIPDGDDIEFHLTRIQGLADGLRSGYFPVKIQSGWYNGFGYPVGVYYGQVLLYPSAILRMIGFPLGFTYKIMLVIINALTFGGTYFVSGRIARDKNTALAFTVFYMLSLYRLVNLYKRCAIGEAQAMAFLPLLMLGFAVLYGFAEDEKKNAWIYLTIAASGIINSHTITTFLAIIICLVFILLNVKKTFEKENLIQYARVFAATILLNLFYLVPFFDYLLNFSKKVDSREGKDMAAKAVYLPQIFSQVYDVTGHNGSYTAAGDMPLSIGISAILIIFVFAILFLKCPQRKERKIYVDLTVLFGLSVFMATALFPYAYLETYAVKIYRVLQQIQYPWRFLTLASLFIFCIFITTVRAVEEKKGQKVKWLFIFSVLVITGWQSTGLMNEIVNKMPAEVHYSATDPFWSEGEYIPSNTDLDELGDRDILTSDPGVVVGSVMRDGINVFAEVRNGTSDTGYVQLPLLYYPYFKVRYADGSILDAIPGDYRKLCFSVPPGYDGEIYTFFKEPVIWRVSEIISLLTLSFLVIFLVKGAKE